MSETARPGREEGLELLRISSEMDRTLVRPTGRAEEGVVVVTFVVRARRLTRAIFCLLDEGLDIEAQMLGRALMETAVTLAWLGKDLTSRISRWRLDDARTRLKWDDEAISAGEALMSHRARSITEALITRLEGSGVRGMPDFRTRCDEIDASWYAAYKQASHGALHATTFALGRFIADVRAEGSSVLAFGDPTKHDDEPYEMPALWLHMSLDVAGMTTRRMPWDRSTLQPALDAIGSRPR